MRLIDADALKARIMVDVPGSLDGGSSITKAIILMQLESRNATPTIDAVPVVRCNDCKYWSAEGILDFKKCRRWINTGVKNFATRGEWFCADGEREKGR